MLLTTLTMICMSMRGRGGKKELFVSWLQWTVELSSVPVGPRSDKLNNSKLPVSRGTLLVG